MTYSAFKDELISIISDRLGEEIHIEVRPFIKNNDHHLDGMILSTASCRISPTIYLNDYFEKYQNHTSLDEISDEICDIFSSHMENPAIDISFFTDFSKIKDRIVFHLVSQEKNKELLKTVPFIPYLDLAIIFLCQLDAEDGSSATILIHKQHLALWQTSLSQLSTLALSNTPRLLPQNIRSMQDVLQDFLDEIPSDEYSMYVLTNTLGLHGASCLLYPHILQNFSEQIQNDFYILPSSIHEVLLVPFFDGVSVEELNSMVQSVNASEVSYDEVLSDHIYYYTRQDQQIHSSSL